MCILCVYHARVVAFHACIGEGQHAGRAHTDRITNEESLAETCPATQSVLCLEDQQCLALHELHGYPTAVQPLSSFAVGYET